MSNKLFSKILPFRDYVEEYGRARQDTDENVIQRMRPLYWITKATDTHSEYVILLSFPRQQWLRERVSMLRLYVHCLSYNLNGACLLCGMNWIFK
jgi:hypothetical protein